MMVEDRTRTEIWQGLWDAKRSSRYFLMMRDRCQRRETLLTAALVLSGTASVATLWDQAPNWLQALFGLVIAMLAIWAALARYATKAATALSIESRCSELSIEWRTLFNQVDNGDVDEVLARNKLNDLDLRLSEAVDNAALVGLTFSKRLNEKAATDASNELLLSYA